MSRLLREGWRWPLRSHHWHYFRDGRSLCGKWKATADDGTTDGGNEDAPLGLEHPKCQEILETVTLQQTEA